MMKKLTNKRITKVVIVILSIVILQSLPIFIRKPLNSKTLSNEHITMFYQEGDDLGAKEVFELLNEKSASIFTQMKVEQKEKIKVYLYTSQPSLSIREAGFITIPFAPSWFIGNSKNGDILMVSPNTQVEGHTHDSILNATLHELVHSIVYQINPKLSYFWDNGLATYISNQKPSYDQIMSFTIPTIEDMNTKNAIKFGNMGGYAFSYNYIEYLDKNYGWDKVMAYANGSGTYEEIFMKSETDIYQEWSQSISN